MSIVNLPYPLDQIFAKSQDLLLFFEQLMVAMVELLNCDRCLLYIRDPELLQAQVIHCHCSNSQIINPIQTQPHSESLYLSEKDPLFTSALQCQRHIFLENVAISDFAENDLTFFQQQYVAHQNIIQAHLCLEGQLWGIVQIAQFKKAPPWTTFDRNIVSTIVDRITPLVSVYVKRKLCHTLQEVYDGDLPTVARQT